MSQRMLVEYQRQLEEHIHQQVQQQVQQQVRAQLEVRGQQHAQRSAKGGDDHADRDEDEDEEGDDDDDADDDASQTTASEESQKPSAVDRLPDPAEPLDPSHVLYADIDAPAHASAKAPAGDKQPGGLSPLEVPSQLPHLPRPAHSHSHSQSVAGAAHPSQSHTAAASPPAVPPHPTLRPRTPHSKRGSGVSAASSSNSRRLRVSVEPSLVAEIQQAVSLQIQQMVSAQMQLISMHLQMQTQLQMQRQQMSGAAFDLSQPEPEPPFVVVQFPNGEQRVVANTPEAMAAAQEEAFRAHQLQLQLQAGGNGAPPNANANANANVLALACAYPPCLFHSPRREHSGAQLTVCCLVVCWMPCCVVLFVCCVVRAVIITATPMDAEVLAPQHGGAALLSGEALIPSPLTLTGPDGPLQQPMFVLRKDASQAPATPAAGFGAYVIRSAH